MMEMMEQKLIAALDDYGFKYDSYSSADEVSFTISFTDLFDIKGDVCIGILEGEDKYDLSTAKEDDDFTPRNAKKAKGVQTVMNYVERFVNC